ncbi:methyl-accepting chemotaxis protein [Shewanella sp. KX20019]|uniref:methyl-accepting chemotaxis protein n=1 Tax=Shewanella sp. KX20019 TaxID=2803864 RepID=UPI00192919F3|nr:methyl-accepting chemotaxis protein [Shewanella sp. KX20019]QQX81519.1 methyl-accepting chemotaxis protein [Shewanella sp. KX20019]
MISLSTRVLIGLASALFIVVTILFSSAYLLEKSKLEQQFVDYQLNTLANLEVTLAQPIFNYDFEQISAALSTSLKSSKIYAISVLDHRGKTMAETRQTFIVDTSELLDHSIKFTDNGKATGQLSIEFSAVPIHTAMNELMTTYIAMALLILVFSVVAIFYILRVLVIVPLAHVVEAMNDIATGDGDLSRKLPVQSQDEIGRLALAFNQFIAQIHGTITKVSETSEQILADATALDTLSNTNNQRVQSQLVDAEAAVTAITQLSGSAFEVANSAKSTADEASRADQEVEHSQAQFDAGLALTDRLANELTLSASSVEQLQQETQKIDEVVVVINAIAEQTNLLALNAAIEAARAGEQGRGFAVVADEVRTLASRTQQATGEIQKMIQLVQHRVKETVTVMQSSQSLSSDALTHSKEIKLLLGKVTEIVSNISNMNLDVASSAKEQTEVTAGISRSLDELVAVSGSASIDSEKLAKSSDRLFHQGEKLRDLVKSFHL